MTALQQLQIESRALRRFRRRLKRLDLKPSEAAEAAQWAAWLDAAQRARWGVRFAAFRRRVDGHG